MSNQGFDEAALDERLQELKRAMQHVGAPGRVEAAVVAEFRRGRVRRSAWPHWALAAAAAAVMVVGAVVLLRHQPAGQTVAQVAPPAETQAGGGVFIPLVPDTAWAPGESAQVIRVSMPRAALGSFGLPVDEARAFEMVRADIVVGQDMVARAIRIVR